jgi:uncharacterized membrane protein
MEGLFLLGLAIPIGLLVGWCLGISGWRQARQARAEIAALRAALDAAGIRVADAPGQAAPNPSPWAQPDPAPVAANPWARPEVQPNWASATETAPPPAAPPAAAGPGLEAALTLRWGTWLGAAALLMAGVFLVSTAIEEGWLGPAARCALAALLGVALVVGAEWLRRKPLPARPGIPWPDQAPGALAAGGVAVLFGAAYATASLYALVPPLVGFALLAAAALAALALALRYGPLVAAVGILGAYATPALVETQDPSLPGLFAYLLCVTATALVVLRQVGAVWLGWAAVLATAGWAVLGGAMAGASPDLWWPALFLPAVAALHHRLLPAAALDDAVGRRLAWIPFAILAAAGLSLMPGTGTSLAAPAGLLLFTPVAAWTGAREPRMDRLPWLAAAAGLLMLLAWPINAWIPAGEAVTIEGVVQAILPTRPWPPEALTPFLATALLLAALHAATGFWQERRAPRPTHWAAGVAAVPVLVLLVSYARVRGFAGDMGWAVLALALAAALVGTTTLAIRADDRRRAGVHAAGAVAALALGAAMLLREQWLTLAVALFLPPLAWIEARAGLPALRRVALAVAAFVLVRLLLNWHVLDYAVGGWPVLNGLLLAYGVPACGFALAAMLFRRRADDATVAVLEAGAIAFVTGLLLLEIRHGVTGGTIADTASGWSFREAALQVTGLATLAALLRLLDARAGGRHVLGGAWRLHQGAALVVGALLLAANPALDSGAAVVPTPVLNELLLAYAIPALLAALAARAPSTDEPALFRPVLAGYAVLAVFAWVTLEARHLFQPAAMALDLAMPGEAELYAYSGAWLLLAGGLLAAGIRLRIPPLRFAALGVTALTIGKAFLIDMDGLVGLWRVLSFLALGLALIALGWIYRRFVVTAPAR